MKISGNPGYAAAFFQESNSSSALPPAKMTAGAGLTAGLVNRIEREACVQACVAMRKVAFLSGKAMGNAAP